MKVIYVFYNTSRPEYTCIGCSDDYKDRLYRLNLYSKLDVKFKEALLYAIENQNEKDLENLLEPYAAEYPEYIGLTPFLKFYNLTADRAVSLFLSLAKITNTEDKLKVKYDSGKQTDSYSSPMNSSVTGTLEKHEFSDICSSYNYVNLNGPKSSYDKDNVYLDMMNGFNDYLDDDSPTSAHRILSNGSFGGHKSFNLLKLRYSDVNKTNFVYAHLGDDTNEYFGPIFLDSSHHYDDYLYIVLDDPTNQKINIFKIAPPTTIYGFFDDSRGNNGENYLSCHFLNDENFTDAQSGFELIRFKISEIDYATACKELFDAIPYSDDSLCFYPSSVTFFGRSKSISSWIDVLSFVIGILAEGAQGTEIRKFIRDASSGLFLPRMKNEFVFPGYELLELNELNMTVQVINRQDFLIGIIRNLLNELEIPLEKLQLEVYVDEDKKSKMVRDVAIGEEPKSNVSEITIESDDKLHNDRENGDSVDKRTAIDFFVSKGFTFLSDMPDDYINFCAYNPKYPHYWINPNVASLDRDWCIILYDPVKRIIRLFKIPVNTFSRSQIKVRPDRPWRIELHIDYKDPDFIDQKSGIILRPYKIAEFSFDELKSVEPEINVSDSHSVYKARSDASFTETPANEPKDGRAITRPIDKIDDATYTHPDSFMFLGKYYPAKRWKDLMDVVFDYAYETNPNKIQYLASSKFQFSSRYRYPLFTYGAGAYDRTDYPHEIKNTGIYYKTNYTSNAIIDILKFILDELSISHDLVICYHNEAREARRRTDYIIDSWDW